jgi:pyruvate-ferredoxin/flavodoxin oxidoreductase
VDRDWITTTLNYTDAEGNARLLEIPFTVADFALHEGRFKKHFHPLNEEDDPVPIHEYIDLSEADRYARAPFIWTTDSDGKLVRLGMTSVMVDLTEERRRNWRMLQYLGGLHIDRMEASHHQQLEQWQQKYQQSSVAREDSIDTIARGMAELAAASGAPARPLDPGIAVTVGTSAQTAAAAGTPAAAGKPGSLLVEITEEDAPRCTNCKTCYQDLGELFEKTMIVVDGSTLTVSRVIPGVFDKIDITPELVQRAARVADDCDAEIIRFHPPTGG